MSSGRCRSSRPPRDRRIAMQITKRITSSSLLWVRKEEQAVSFPKIAATLSLASALSLVSHGPAQSAPLTSLSAAAKPGTEQANAVQVRWRRGWHNGAGAAPPYYYGGSYLGYTYGVFPGA